MASDQQRRGALKGWTDYVYLSNSPTLDTSNATQLTTAPDQSLLAAGASYTTYLTGVIVPSVPAGNYHLFVVADADDGQVESDTAASVSSPVSVTLTAPAVDLVSSNPVLPSTSLVADQKLKVSWTIKNQGTETAQSTWYDNVYLSTKSTLDSSATRLTNYSGLSGTSPLAAGASYTQSANVTVPNVVAGSYYLLFVANDGQSQGESSYAGDVAAVAVTVGTPDLAITTASATPTTALLDSPVSVTWTVTNQGTVPAYASWYDEVYLCSRSTYDNSAQWLDDVYVNNSSAPLAAGASYTKTDTINISSKATGPMYLLVNTNADEYQGETNYANDWTAIPITLVAPNVTLALTAASVSSATVNRGNDVTVSWTVQNTGTNPTGGPWEDYVYLSTKNTFDSSATLLERTDVPSSSLPLTGGATYNQSDAYVYLSSSLAPGNYYLFVVADGNQSQYETSTAGNVSAAIPITVTVPDLTVTAATAPSAAVLGSSISVSWTVENTGGAIAGSYWYDAVYVSSSQKLDSTATQIDDFWENRAPLANGASYTDAESIYLPSTAVGNRYLLFVADSDNYLDEADTADKVYALPISLTGADLAVTQATANPPTVQSDGAVSVSWTVLNQGTAAAASSWDDSVYLSTKSTYDSSATYLDDVYIDDGGAALRGDQLQPDALRQHPQRRPWILLLAGLYERGRRASGERDGRRGKGRSHYDHCAERSVGGHGRLGLAQQHRSRRLGERLLDGPE